MASLEKAAEVVLKKCMALKDFESCMILTDENKLNIASAFLKSAEQITKNVKLIQIPVGKVNGEEPPVHVAEQMKDFNVIIMPTSKSLSWTKAREEATTNGTRVASMPGITKEIMERCVDVPYGNMKSTTVDIAKNLSSADKIEITSPSGTNITMSVKGMDWFGSDSGIYNQPGKWGNLPSGEAFVAPVETTTNGTAVIDASMAGIGKIEHPITIIIKDGFAVDIKGGQEAKDFKQMLDDVKSKKAFNVAELGIGTNPKAVISGAVLEDEKVLGTCHIAFGNNSLFGGTTDVPIHVDGIIKKPTIKADGKLIMENGQLI